MQGTTLGSEYTAPREMDKDLPSWSACHSGEWGETGKE